MQKNTMDLMRMMSLGNIFLKNNMKPKLHSPDVLLGLFKSRSISGFIIWLGGPLNWSSKRQTITAHSSTEVEMYTTGECCKSLSHSIHLI